MARAIINGKLYDTKNAELVSWDSMHGPSSWHHWREELYLTAKGSWFLFGKGGPASKYAVREGTGWGYGESIKPLRAPEALDWLETAGDVDSIEEHFAAEIEEA